MLLRDRAVVAAKKEAVEGTAETLAVGDATLLVFETNFKPAPEFTTRNPTADTLSWRKSVRGKAFADFSFKFELKGEDSTADSVPAWGPIMEAAGFLQTVNVGTNVEWVHRNDLGSAPSLTMGGYVDGIVRKIRGARCTSWTLTMPTGGTFMVAVTFRGVIVSPGDAAAALLAPTYPTAEPEVFGQGVCTLDAVQYTGTTIEVNLGLKTVERLDPNFEYGCKSVGITNREPTATLDPELELPATKAYLNEMLANTAVDLQAQVGTGVTGHEVTVDLDQIQWEGMDDSNREDMATAGMTARILGPEAGGTDIKITKA